MGWSECTSWSDCVCVCVCVRVCASIPRLGSWQPAVHDKYVGFLACAFHGGLSGGARRELGILGAMQTPL